MTKESICEWSGYTYAYTWMGLVAKKLFGSFDFLVEDGVLP